MSCHLLKVSTARFVQKIPRSGLTGIVDDGEKEYSLHDTDTYVGLNSIPGQYHRFPSLYGVCTDSTHFVFIVRIF